MGIIDVAEQLVVAAAAAYADESDMTPVLIPGQLLVNDFAWSGCGAVFIRLDAAYPSTRFPTPDVAPAPCGAPVAARFHIGVTRCLHGPDSSGNAPGFADQSADTLTIIDDAVKLRTMLCTVAAAQPDTRSSTSLGTWQPWGPLGNAGGGWWPFTVRILR